MIGSVKLIVVKLGIIKFVKIIVFVLLIYCCVMCLCLCTGRLLPKLFWFVMPMYCCFVAIMDD